MNHDEACFICRKHRDGTGAPGGALYEDDLVFTGHAAVLEDGTLPLLGHYLNMFVTPQFLCKNSPDVPVPGCPTTVRKQQE